MIEYAAILTRGGLALWAHSLSSLPPTSTSASPESSVNALICNVFLTERASDKEYSHGEWLLQWVFDNEFDLVVVIVYPKIVQLTYGETLLKTIKSTFTTRFQASLHDKSSLHSFAFTPEFLSILSIFNTSNILGSDDEGDEAEGTNVAPGASTNSSCRKGPRDFKESRKYQNSLAAMNDKKDENGAGKGKENSVESLVSSSTSSSMSNLSNPDYLKSSKFTKGSAKETEGNNNNKKKKKMRVWDGQVSNALSKDLDYSNSSSVASEEPAPAGSLDHLVDSQSLGNKTSEGLYDAAELTSQPVAKDAKPSATSISNWFNNLTSRTLTETDLEPFTIKLRDHLINKNVAPTIATDLTKNITSSLLGKKCSTFQSVQTQVQAALEESLQRILTPRTSTDLLKDVLESKKRRKTFSMVFVGVNGVGKSTNLSKVCFWLLQNKLKILIAACDTFRSGAVEQLRVHVRNLNMLTQQLSKDSDVSTDVGIELFERGYGKDAAGIAKEAIGYAQQRGFDVVLVDTAGRMQDNEPLMRSLAKLVTSNNPDRIVFVGEALVGNEAVDQLSKFNLALKELSGNVGQNYRQIDGIILTKFDTIDDKVGAALSMTYMTGQPILFVGTGQTYTDLKKMNVKAVVDSLMK